MASRRGIRQLIQETLDDGFEAVAGDTIDDIISDAPEAVLRQLNQRAQQLDNEGERFVSQDLVLGATLVAFADYLARSRGRIDDVSPAVQDAGVQATLALELPKALIGVPPAQARIISDAWTVPDGAVLSQAVNYANSPVFISSMGRYEQGTLGIAQNIIVKGQGWGALRMARALTDAVKSLPAHYANSLLRSLQLTAHRDANVLYHLANADILQGHVRIASLDDRTCATCIALHGTLLRLGERVHDHRNGRCTSVPLIKGRENDIVSGPDWFNDLDSDAQALLAPFAKTPAKLAALRAGAIDWPDFVKQEVDPIFGEIVTEAALSDMLGSTAKQFYL